MSFSVFTYFQLSLIHILMNCGISKTEKRQLMKRINCFGENFKKKLKETLFIMKSYVQLPRKKNVNFLCFFSNNERLEKHEEDSIDLNENTEFQIFRQYFWRFQCLIYDVFEKGRTGAMV
jgi:hypothetical protein